MSGGHYAIGLVAGSVVQGLPQAEHGGRLYFDPARRVRAGDVVAVWPGGDSPPLIARAMCAPPPAGITGGVLAVWNGDRRATVRLDDVAGVHAAYGFRPVDSVSLQPL